MSTSGADVRSNKQSLMMHWVSVGILSDAMSYKAFVRGTMQSNTTVSLDVKHSRVMYLTKSLCSNVHLSGVVTL